MHKQGKAAAIGLALLLVCLAMPLPAVAAGVVGTGTAASCTEAALDAALAGAGAVPFSCGGGATITVTSAKTISNATVIDGGNVITLDGNRSVGVLSVTSAVLLDLKNIKIANGSALEGGGIHNSGTRTAAGRDG